MEHSENEPCDHLECRARSVYAEGFVAGAAAALANIGGVPPQRSGTIALDLWNLIASDPAARYEIGEFIDALMAGRSPSPKTMTAHPAPEALASAMPASDDGVAEALAAARAELDLAVAALERVARFASDEPVLGILARRRLTDALGAYAKGRNG